MDMEAIAIGAAANLTSSAIIELLTYVKNATESEKNLQFLTTDLTRMEGILLDIRSQFEDQQRMLPPLLQNSLESMKSALQEVRDLIDGAKRQRQRCLGLGWCLFCKPKLVTQITEWKTNRCNQLLQQLDSDVSRAADIAQLLESADTQTDVLLQPISDCRFVGDGIRAAQTKLQIWLNEPNRVIGVYGMGGVGKTSLLQLIHNDCKEKVSTNFDFVIWNTVSGSQSSKIPLPNEEFDRLKIESLQYTIAESVGLDIKGISIDTRKMRLNACLKNKRFLLILDDVWRPIDLDQVGVNFGHDNSSRVLISCRNKFVVETMAANYQYFVMEIEPLSTEDGWDLFRRKAFRNGPAPEAIEAIARDIAEECQGLPLALNVVAAAMAPKTGADEWERALDLMRKVHPSLSSTHPTIHDQLYQRLKWSYNDLPSDLKMCFLYCAAFPEDEWIPVETLVEMWTAESLVPQRRATYYMDVGREYIKALVDRCLIQYDEGKDAIRVHDVLRDMAIYVGEGEEKGLYLSSQHLQHFPTEEETRDRKRISLLNNQISYLPTDLRCQTLVSLVLAQNRELKQIPDRFFENLTSLKVLDLSETAIKALPASVGQLGQLQCLHLKHCRKLKELPDRIGELKHLQFLNLSYCRSLKYLPDRIGELKHLKHLNLKYVKLRVNPHQICQLTSLNRLVLTEVLTPMSLEDLTNLSYLIELDVTVKPDIKGSSMSSWSEMRELTFIFSEDAVEDDAALLPQNMQSMKKLQTLSLWDYRGVSLPNCISRFQNLKELRLCICGKLKEFPGLEIGSDAASDGFPMLERLTLWYLDSLESIVWNENTMLKLNYLNIKGCPVLKSFRTEELPNLRELLIEECDELSNVSQIGSLPMLETLSLRYLDSLESIVWNEKTMLKLQHLTIDDCRVLKSFRTEELPNLRELKIESCDELSNVSQIGSLPMLEKLQLWDLKSFESIVWNEKTMLKLKELTISGCPVLKSFRTEELPNLRELWIGNCDELSNVSQIGRLPMLETLQLSELEKLESIAHWNDKTMPNLQNLKVSGCPMLTELPKGLDKLSNLTKIEGSLDWWNGIVWENHHTVYGKVSQFFRET